MMVQVFALGLVSYGDTSVSPVSSNNQSWLGENSNSVDPNNPWVIRGGNSNNGSNAGLFYTNTNDGSANNNNGFRVVQRVAPKCLSSALRRRKACTHTLRDSSSSLFQF